jgi:hypothetical protein
MELEEFDLPLLKQQIKYLISLSDIKAESGPFYQRDKILSSCL